MGKGQSRLSDAECRNAKPRIDGKALILPDGGGLRLVVKPHGVKEWQLRFTVAAIEGTQRKESALSLGQYPAVGLGAARAERDRINEQAKAGKNPTLERQIENIQLAAERVTTFRSIAAELIELKVRNGISPKYKKKCEGIFLSCLFPLLGDLPIQVITSPILKETLKPIEERGKLDLLNDARRLSGEVFNLAKANGQFTGDNPAEALKSNVFAKHRGTQRLALAWSEMNGFLHRLDAGRLNPETVACIKLLMMTATRPGESREARWSEFNLDAACWTIPGERMKSRKEHRIPLASQAVAMLRELHHLTGEREYLFPAQRGAKAACLTDMGLLKAVRIVAGHDLVDAHGFRATFRTYAEESGQWSFDAMEAALSHGKKNAVVAAYARATHYAERAKLAQWYADELDNAKRGALVIHLPSAA